MAADMLMGSYPMTVDAKARVTLPSDFRNQIDSKTIVLVPFRGHVNGFTPDGFNAWLRKLKLDDESIDERNEKDVRLRSGLVGTAQKVDLDSAGRLALGKLDSARPGALERLGLTADVFVVGQTDHFEVWNAEKWSASLAAFDEDSDALLFGSE